MKVGIDASRAFLKERTGTEEYAYQLIKNLTKTSASFCQFFLYVGKGCNIDFDLPDNFKIKKIDRTKNWTQIGLSLEMLFSPVDVLFIPSHSISFIHPKNTVVTIHGLEYRNCPECFTSKEKLILELNTRLSSIWAARIITPSASTKKDLVKYYKTDPEKITVVHHGVEHGAWNMEHEASSQINTSNILFIGRLEKRKNLVNLIKAFEIFKENCKLQAVSYKLILAGKAGFGFDEIKKEIERSVYKNDIILKGYVSQDEKEYLYDNADIFIFPSFAEGFGMPILEAMSHGVPVICSNISSLAEITGDSALMIDPNSSENMAAMLKKMSEDDEFRDNMIRKGFENIKRFSWEKCAKKTMEVFLNA